MIRYLLVIFILLKSFSFCQNLNFEGNIFFSSKEITKITDIFFERSESKKKEINLQNQSLFKDYLIYQYKKNGFFDVQILIENSDKINFKIQENKRYILDKIWINFKQQNFNNFDLKLLKLKQKDFFLDDNLKYDLSQIKGFYKSQGYLKVNISKNIKVEESLGLVEVEFKVNLGVLFVFDTLMITILRSGTENKQGKSNENYIRSLFDVKKGNIIQEYTFYDFIGKIRSTKNFISVNIEDSVLSNQKVAVILKLIERVPGDVIFSLFGNTEDGLGIKLQVNYLNFFGNFYHGNIGGRFAQFIKSFFVSFTDPLFLKRRVVWSNRVSTTLRENDKTKISPFILDFKTTLGVSHKYYRMFSTLELVAKKKIGIQNNSVFNANVLFSFNVFNTSFLINSTKGFNSKVIYGNGGSFIDSKNNINIQLTRHNWLELKNSIYFPLSFWSIFGFRFDSGYFFQKGQDNSRRFFLGGNNSVRSYESQTICPSKDAETGFCYDNIQIAYLLWSVEFRLAFFKNIKLIPKVLRNIQVVPFLDAASIWEVDFFSKRTTVSDVGLGFRIPIFIFYLRLDYAVKFDMSGFDLEQSRFIVEVSNSF